MITLIIFAVIFALLCIRELNGLRSVYSDPMDFILVLGWAVACTITVLFALSIHNHTG